MYYNWHLVFILLCCQPVFLAPIEDGTANPSPVNSPDNVPEIPSTFNTEIYEEQGNPQIPALTTYKTLLAAIAALALRPYEDVFHTAKFNIPDLKIAFSVFSLDVQPGELKLPIVIREGMWGIYQLAEKLTQDKPPDTATLSASWGYLIWHGRKVGGIYVRDADIPPPPYTFDTTTPNSSRTDEIGNVTPTVPEISPSSNTLDIHVAITKTHRSLSRADFIFSLFSAILNLAADTLLRTLNLIESYTHVSTDHHTLTWLNNKVSPYERRGLDFYSIAVQGLAVLYEEAVKMAKEEEGKWFEIEFEIEVAGREGKIFEGQINMSGPGVGKPAGAGQTE